MKSPSEINTITNELPTKLSSATDQVSKSSITNNNTEQFSMKSPSEISTNTNESSTKLSSTTNHISKFSISNNNTEQISMKYPLQLPMNCLPKSSNDQHILDKSM